MTASKGTASATVHNMADVRAVRSMLADAEPVKRVRKVDPPAGGAIDGIEPGKWRGQACALGLPPGCPIKPLGVSGKRLWFLNTIAQLDYLEPPMGKVDVLQLFGGRLDYLCWAWPRYSKEGEVAGFANDNVVADLIAACKALGPWDATDQERWQGCWRGPGGDLVMHCGDHLVMGGRKHPPGEYEGYVYPARPKMLAPWALGDDLPAGYVGVLRSTLRSWSWSRPEVDPHLLLGWIGAAFLGGALPWRPMVFMTGGAGTGKSSLQQMLRAVFGGWLFHAEDTTRAGISQPLGMSSVAVSVDELESEGDSRKAVEILKLARLASSGGTLRRGGDRHQGVSFTVRSAFLFSSINAPPLQPQDLSRMALLQLKPLPVGQAAPAVDGPHMAMFGRYILRRLLEEWHRFDETCAAFAAELGAAGMNQRGQAQFGTLLACADMIEHRGWDDARLSFALEYQGELVPWRKLLAMSEMTEFEDTRDNWMGRLSHLLGARAAAWRSGTRATVGEALVSYWSAGVPGKDLSLHETNTLLGQAGLKIVFLKKGPRARPYLAVHNNGPMVGQLFSGSTWAGLPGVGVWKDALRQGPPGTLWEKGQPRINGVQQKATLISLEGLYGDDGIMAQKEETEADG